MKPFDLEAAKRGEPIVTRDGREAKFIAHVPELGNLPLVVMIENTLTQLQEDGSWVGDCKSSYDIFMAPKKRTVWVNFYPSVDNEPPLAMTHKSQEKANRDGLSHRIGGKAYPVEIEE